MLKLVSSILNKISNYHPDNYDNCPTAGAFTYIYPSSFTTLVISLNVNQKQGSCSKHYVDTIISTEPII